MESKRARGPCVGCPDEKPDSSYGNSMATGKLIRTLLPQFPNNFIMEMNCVHTRSPCQCHVVPLKCLSYYYFIGVILIKDFGTLRSMRQKRFSKQHFLSSPITCTHGLKSQTLVLKNQFKRNLCN